MSRSWKHICDLKSKNDTPAPASHYPWLDPTAESRMPRALKPVIERIQTGGHRSLSVARPDRGVWRPDGVWWLSPI